VIALLTNQVIHVVADLNAQGFLDRLTHVEFYANHIRPYLEFVQAKLGLEIDANQILKQIGVKSAESIYNFSPKVLSRTATFAFSFFVMHLSVFFLFIEGKKLFQIFLDIAPLAERYERRLALECKNMIHATVWGYLLTALVQALLAWACFAFVGLNASLIFAVLTFFMSMVPIVGATSVWLPMGVWFLIQGDTHNGLIVLVYGALIISGIDNILKPLIMRGKVQIPILLIFFSLIGGMALFGPIGILFGPVITALFLACIRIYREEFVLRGHK